MTEVVRIDRLGGGGIDDDEVEKGAIGSESEGEGGD